MARSSQSVTWCSHPAAETTEKSPQMAKTTEKSRRLTARLPSMLHPIVHREIFSTVFHHHVVHADATNQNIDNIFFVPKAQRPVKSLPLIYPYWLLYRSKFLPFFVHCITIHDCIDETSPIIQIPSTSTYNCWRNDCVEIPLVKSLLNSSPVIIQWLLLLSVRFCQSNANFASQAKNTSTP